MDFDKIKECLMNTDDGQRVFDKMIIWGAKGQDAEELMYLILDWVSHQFPDEFRAADIGPCIEANKDYLSGWFNGICADGERALRTIKYCCLALHKFEHEKQRA